MHHLKSAFWRSVFVIVLIGGHALASTASAQEGTATAEDQARAHFRLGRAHYDNGNFAEAAVEFEQAYNISQRAALLYNIYLAYRDANNTERAAWALKEYLEREKDIENRPQLQARLRALEEANAAAPPADGAVVAAPVAEPAPGETQPGPEAATEPAPEGKKTNILPYVLMGSGGAMVIGSIITGAMASGKKSEAEDICPGLSGCDPADKGALDDLESSQGTLAVVTDILLFGGIAVAGTGAVLLVLDLTSGGASESSDAPSASLACLPGACHGSVKMHF